MFRLSLLSALLIFHFSVLVQAQTQRKQKPPQSRILFVFDGSQSMMGTWKSDKKINIARRTLISIVDSLEQVENVQMALRIYGHQSPVPPQDCNDTKLEVPFAKGNGGLIRQELRYINPKGTTPIANSLAAAGKDFPDVCLDCRNIIILITDGIEACDGDPCAVSYELQKQGIVLRPFVIGIGIDEGFRDTFECIGNYYNASDEESFKEVLEVVISQALNSTTAQVNLLDQKGKPTETNVNMTFSDNFSGKIMYNYIHTMNYKGMPDTLILDHLVNYDLKVHTIPPVEVKNIDVEAGKHTIMKVKCPQGKLMLKVNGGVQYRGLQYIVRKADSQSTLNMQEVNEEELYLVGKYDLEIPVLPRIYMDDVSIKQGETTEIKIPRPGILNLIKSASGYGSIYKRLDSKREVWVTNINNNVKNETVVLQPGKYRIVFRAQNSKQTLYTINKLVVIKSGSAEVVQLY